MSSPAIPGCSWVDPVPLVGGDTWSYANSRQVRDGGSDGRGRRGITAARVAGRLLSLITSPFRGRRAAILPFLVLAAVAVPAAGEAPEAQLLETSFEDGADAPTGWVPSGAAIWSVFARTGKRSLEIRAWQPDSVMDELARQQAAQPAPIEEFRKKVRADPERTSWVSAPLTFSGLPVKVSFWRASHITWANDESFRAEVGLQSCDEQGQPKGDVISERPLHFYEIERTSYQMLSLAVPGGLLWEYREAVLTPPKGQGRLVFRFLKFPSGQAWIDDLFVTESAGYAAPKPATETSPAAGSATPWKMQINFPVSFNLFRSGDPLECDIAVAGGDAPPEIRPGMTVTWEVRDFNFRYLHGETVTLKAEQVVAYPERDTKARLILLTLPGLLNAHERKVLFLRARLLDGEKLLAEDEVAWGIVEPIPAKAENLWRGCKVVPNWQPEPDVKSDFGKPDFPYNGHAHKLGAQWNAAPIGGRDYLEALGFLPYEWKWSDHLKSPDGEVKFPPTKHVFPDYGIHVEGYILQVYKKGLDPYRSTPDWARESGRQKYGDQYGYPVFDIDGYARFVAARVKRLHEVFPNAAVYCPTAGEVPHDQFRHDLQKAACRAARAAAPDVRIGTWVWGKTADELPERIRDSFDIIDTELYGDPQVGMGKDLGDLAKQLSKATGRKIPAMALEGCAKTGSERQIDSAKGVFDFHAHGWMNGVSHLGQYEFGTAHTAASGGPVLRGDLINIFSGTGHTGGAQRPKLTRYDTEKDRLFCLGGSPPTHYQPALPTMAFANVIRWMDSAEPDRRISIEDIWAFVFKRYDRGLLFIETMRDWGERQVELTGVPSAFDAIDIYGNRYRVEPRGGKCLLTVSIEPLVLTFDKPLDAAFTVRHVPEVQIKTLVPIVRRNPGAVSVALGPDRGGTLALDTDPKLKVPDAVPVKAGETARIGITPLEERPSGKYRTTIRLMDGPTLVGLLSVPLAFESSAITARCIGLPMTAKSQPAVRVSLQNGAEKEQEVTVRFRDIWTSGAMRPAVTEARLKLPALSTASTDFPVTRDRVHLNQNYPVSVDVVSADGFSRTFRDPVHFRAIPRATSPIQVDADLADWNTGALLPLEPNWMWGLRSHTNSGASKNYSLTWKEQNDPEGNFRLYLLWRDDSLYLAATVNNTSRQHPAVDKDLENLWAQDCLYVVMYPSEFVRGEGTATFPHKMHLGLDGRGKPCLQDGDGNVFLDPKEVDCDYAVRETERGYTYEFRMGPKYPGFRGLKVRPGAHLSLSVMAWRNKGDRCYAFFRHFASFEGSIGDMGAFVLVDE